MPDYLMLWKALANINAGKTRHPRQAGFSSVAVTYSCGSVAQLLNAVPRNLRESIPTPFVIPSNHPLASVARSHSCSLAVQTSNVDHYLNRRALFHFLASVFLPV
jgi:hypothetical protein